MAYSRTAGFRPVKASEWELREIPLKASTAIEIGCAISPEISSNDVTGHYTKMGVENATGSDFTGIMAEEIASTDSDYATAGKLKKVWVRLVPEARAYFTVGAGTFTAVDVGRTVELHSDSKSLAVDTKGKGAKIEKYISSSKGVCSFPMPFTETA
jgi:hypothetical protein